MFGKRFIGLVLAGGMLAATGMAADVVVRVAPPHAVIEKRAGRPGRDYVWVNGYHRYEGNTYVWTPGRWERPPRAHARWHPHHWVKRNGGYVLVEGYWG